MSALDAGDLAELVRSHREYRSMGIVHMIGRLAARAERDGRAEVLDLVRRARGSVPDSYGARYRPLDQDGLGASGDVRAAIEGCLWTLLTDLGGPVVDPVEACWGDGPAHRAVWPERVARYEAACSVRGARS